MFADDVEASDQRSECQYRSYVVVAAQRGIVIVFSMIR
jgi:hypothetical protein